MAKFQYFYFDLLKPHLLAEILPEANASRLEVAYEDFLNWYIFKGRLFYHDQLGQHNELLIAKFCRENQVNQDYLFDDEDIREAFYEYQDAWGYNTHTEHYARWSEQHQRKTQRGSLKVTARALIEEFERVFLKGEEMGRDLPKIIPAWFNTQINNTPEQQKELRAMPYPDYLKSTHWLRVRALTTLTFGATCVGKECDWNFEGMWDSWGSMKHIHHLSYKNRGNERFGDVCVLCSSCHKKHHEKTAEILDENSVSDFLARQWTAI